MYNNFFNNPYALQNQMLQNQMKQEVVKVNGENGARAFQIPPNSSALLLDESGLLVWLVVTDGAGYKSVMSYDITPHKAAPAVDFGSLETRISRLEEMMNEHTNDTTTTEQRSNKPTNQPDKRYDDYAQKRK